MSRKTRQRGKNIFGAAATRTYEEASAASAPPAPKPLAERRETQGFKDADDPSPLLRDPRRRVNRPPNFI